MTQRGRPKTSSLSRAEQLRRAKRRQRARDKRDGLVLVQMKLPAATARRLRAAQADGVFANILGAALDRALVNVEDFPVLQDLAWNVHRPLIAAREAFGLYERNWRHVDASRLTAKEQELIERLTRDFGGGLINA